MNRLRKTHSSSCSCTSCVKNAQNRSSLQKLIVKGSKVDRLYFGKYIPLRERKLLDKLVRTRAVYDDIRAQLVSDSTSSLQKNANFISKKRSSATDIDDTDKSNAILELVNLVDKGAALNTSQLSSCCSCCSCASQTNVRGHKYKEHRHKQHKHRTGDVDNHAMQRLRNDFKRKGGVRFKAKQIKSDLCTCTFKFLSQVNPPRNKMESTEYGGRERRPRLHKIKKVAKESLQSIADSKTNLKNKVVEGTKKLQESTTMLQDKLALRANESLEKIKQVKDQIKSLRHPHEEYSSELDYYLAENEGTAKDKMKNLANKSYQRLRDSQTQLKNKILDAGEVMDVKIKRSIEKLKETQSKMKESFKSLRKHKNRASVTCMCPEKGLVFKIRKDSIRKFKDDMKKKQKMADWTCDPDCIEGTCFPEKCFEKLKVRNAQRVTNRKRRNVGIASYTDHSEKEVNVHSKGSISQIQTDMPMKSAKRNRDDTHGLKLERTKHVRKHVAEGQSGIISETRQRRIHEREDLSSTIKSKHRQAVRIGSSFSFNVEFSKNIGAPNIKYANPVKNKPYRNEKHTKRVKRYPRASQISFKRTSKDFRPKVHALKRCFCTLKLKPKKPKVHPRKSVSTMSSFTSNNYGKLSHELLPYECEPGICIPNQCNPHECLKMINKRVKTRKMQSRYSLTSSRRTKSTSSFTSKYATSSKAKQVQSAIVGHPKRKENRQNLKLTRKGVNVKNHNRNVVRIGSTFSFDIEFYKNRSLPNHEYYEHARPVNTFSIAPKNKEYNHHKYQNQNANARANRKKYKYQNAPVIPKKKHKYKNAVIGTENVDEYEYAETVNRGTRTNDINNYTLNLEPYECEPFTCTPGYCDPYVCLERIKKRNKRTRDVSLGTLEPESRSNFSSTYSETKSRGVMHHIPRTKARKVLVKAPRQYNRKIKKPLSSDNKSKKSVTLGSSFSFNIEFSKSSAMKNANANLIKLSTPKRQANNEMKHQGIKMHKNSMGSMETQMDYVKKVDKSSVAGPLKRCFCTLNLIRKQNQSHNFLRRYPKNAVYVVNTAAISNTNFRKLVRNDTKYVASIESFEQKNETDTMRITDLNKGIDVINEITNIKSFHNERLTERSSQHINRSLNYHQAISKNTLSFDSKNVTGLSCYLKRSFYSMNMENRHVRKLKPYECEPGVCTPGQCNPYECQKLIMKRLRQKKHSVTVSPPATASIGTNEPKYSSRKLNSSSQLDADREHKLVKKQNDLHDMHKQKVRVGSSFSFDVEFFKQYSVDEVRTGSGYIRKKPRYSPNLDKVKKKRLRYKTAGTKFNKIPRYHDSQSQSESQPEMLTLNKKGKILEKRKSKSTYTNTNDSITVKTIDKGQGQIIQKPRRKYKSTNTVRALKSTGVSSFNPVKHSQATTIRVNRKNKKIMGKLQSAEPGDDVKKNGNKVESYALRSDNRKGQRVRIGSNFKFDIEFYKESKSKQSVMDKVVDRSSERIRKDNNSSQVEFQPKYEVKKHNSLKTKNTYTNPISNESGLQTNVISKHTKAEAVKPFLNRCFCTLKLRNRNKKKKEDYSPKENIQQKSVAKISNNNTYAQILEPFECEPNVCIPGQCDPYECEKRIRKRLKLPPKDRATSPEQMMSSISVMTTQSTKTEGINTGLKVVSANKSNYTRADESIYDDKKVGNETARQAVRIGSSFSFEVEFSKNILKRGIDDTHQPIIQPEIQLSKVKKQKRTNKHKQVNFEHLKKKQENPKYENILKVSDSQTPKEHKSRRSTITRVSPFVDKCLCTLKLLKRKRKRKHSIKSANIGIETDVQKINPNTPVQLFPYECEPDFCILGQCDPLICLERIKKRNVKSFGVETFQRPRKSIGSNSTPSIKNKKIQKKIKLKTNKRQIDKDLLVSKGSEKGSKIKTNKYLTEKGLLASKDFEKEIKFKTNKDQIDNSTHKQAVRIASNFSFDIEFHKHHSIKHKEGPHVQKTTIAKQYIDHTESRKSNKTTKKPVQTESLLRTVGSQTLATLKSDKSELNHKLERCFCTLSLHKSRQEKQQKKNKIAQPKYKTVATNKSVEKRKSRISFVGSFFTKKFRPFTLNKNNQPGMKIQVKAANVRKNKNVKILEPYECEPYTCVPGSCDPYECLERIKRRKLRENATLTHPNPNVTKSSFTHSQKIQHTGTNPKKYNYVKSTSPLKTFKTPDIVSSVPKNKNIQGVRIGSSFSFDIEFSKDKGERNFSQNKLKAVEDTLPNNKLKKENFKKDIRNKQINNYGRQRSISQLTEMTTIATNTVTDTAAPNRCFCTLQLHKNPMGLNKNLNQRKPLHKTIQAKNQIRKRNITSTKNQTTLQYVATRFECPPFCINKLNNMNCQEDYNTNIKTDDKSMIAKTFHTKTKKIQCSPSKCITDPKQFNHNIVEVPRFDFLNNKQSAKISSKSSLNVEFSKEMLPSNIDVNVYNEGQQKTFRIQSNSERLSNHIKFKKKNQNINTVIHSPKTKKKIKIKSPRCFCTLKLPNKDKFFKDSEQKILAQPPYPQVVEVRRVQVQKNKPTKQTNTEARSVGTNINERLLSSKYNNSNKCYCLKTENKTDTEAMETILPYRATKFKKTNSKTMLTGQEKINFNSNKKSRMVVSNDGKRLTKKQSTKSFTKTDSGKIKPFGLKRFLCECANKFLGNKEKQTYPIEYRANTYTTDKKGMICFEKKPNEKIFKRRYIDVPIANNLISSYSDSKPQTAKSANKIKTSRSLKLRRNQENNADPQFTYSEFNAGDAEHGTRSQNREAFCPHCLSYQDPVRSNKSYECPYCQTCLKRGILKNYTTSLGKQKNKNMNSQQRGILKNYTDTIDEPKNKNVILQQKPNIKFLNKYFTSFMKFLNVPHITKRKSEIKPLFEMYVDSSSMNVINAEEISAKVTKFKTKHKNNFLLDRNRHGKSCRCCVCLGKGANVKIHAKKPSIKKRRSSKEKCVCGSKICAKAAVSDRKATRHQGGSHYKPCVCGSTICDKESAAMNRFSNSTNFVCSCKEVMEKRREKEYLKRKNKYKKLDKDRLQKFRKKQKEKDKPVNKSISDIALVTESLLDIAKLGFTGIQESVRCLYRSAKHPKHTIRNIKKCKDDPSKGFRKLKSRFKYIGIGRTGRRIKNRLLSTKTIGNVKALLESRPLTNYILHIGSKGPKKHTPKRIRRRERTDFGCSLFAVSLRKRRFTYIFDRCPWFYPHCISLLNVWRQFTEVALFVLAVVVWSPCIVAMELCRAVICCTLCTG